jgi:hypothetical protein
MSKLFKRIDMNLNILASEIAQEHPQRPFSEEIFAARFELGHRYMVREIKRSGQSAELQQ